MSIYPEFVGLEDFQGYIDGLRKVVGDSNGAVPLKTNEVEAVATSLPDGSDRDALLTEWPHPNPPEKLSSPVDKLPIIASRVARTIVRNLLNWLAPLPPS